MERLCCTHEATEHRKLARRLGTQAFARRCIPQCWHPGLESATLNHEYKKQHAGVRIVGWRNSLAPRPLWKIKHAKKGDQSLRAHTDFCLAAFAGWESRSAVLG